MTRAGQHPVAAPCPRCTGYGDAHYLTCPTLRLPFYDDDDQAEQDSMNAEPDWREVTA